MEKLHCLEHYSESQCLSQKYQNMAKNRHNPQNFPAKNSKTKVSNNNEISSFTATVRMSTNELTDIFTNKSKKSSPSKGKHKESPK